MTSDLPDLLKLLKETLGYRLRRLTPAFGYELFFIDLSTWKLRLSAVSPVIWVKESDLENATPQIVLQSIGDVLREKSWRETVLVLVDGDAQELMRARFTLGNNVVLIGAAEQEGILKSRRPSGALLDVIAAQIRISLLSPYETHGPVTGNRFFGREAELALILSRPSTYLILGIRRIGKTSLLRETQRRMLPNEGEPAENIIFFDCSDLLTSADFIRETVRKLNPRELPRIQMQQNVFYFPDFLERMSRSRHQPLIFLLDEIDNLVQAQQGNWELFRIFRAAANMGFCRFIMAGFRAADQAYTDINSPLYNFAQGIRLSEFSREQARELILIPLENLRVRIHKPDEVVNRIYEETSGSPNLIQFYCMSLLRQLDENVQRDIYPENLASVYHDEGFRSHLLGSFWQNTENQEKALVYVLAKRYLAKSEQAFPLEVIDIALRREGLLMPLEAIIAATRNLILAGLMRQVGKNLVFTSPIFALVLGEMYDLDFLLQRTKQAIQSG